MTESSITETASEVNTTLAESSESTVPAAPSNNCSAPDPERIRHALSQVVDPELHMNIIELGLVYSVIVDNSKTPPPVQIEMTLTSPGCPYGPMIMGQVPIVLKETFGETIGEVDVQLTFSPPWDPATMASEDVKFELGIF